MANSPSEDTTCLNMKRDFNSFLSGTGPRRPGATKHGLHFSLDESHQSKNGQQHSTSISVRSLLDKDRQDKLKEAEIISANTRISELKSQISHLETAHKKAKIEHEKEMGIVQQESQNEIHRLSEYKERWQYLIDKETETQEQCTIIRKQLDTCKTSYEQKLCKLQKEKLQLEEDLQQSEEGKQAKELEMKNEIWRQKTELDICKNELDETRERLKLQLKRSSEVTAQLQEMEEYKMRAVNAERKIKDLEDEVRRFEEDSVLVKAMKSQLASLPDLEREIRTLKDKNNHLRATQENVALIEEEMISLRSRLDRADQRCAEMAKIQVQNDELKLKIQQWEVTDGDDGRKISPVELKQRLAEAQSAQLASLEKEGQLQSRIRSLEDSLKSRGEQQSVVSSRLTQETSRTVQQTDMIRRLQKKVLIIAKERDAFKRILDSYESEMTVNLEAHAGSRLQAQDESLSGYRKQVEALEEELQRKSEQLTQETTRAQQLELRLQEVVSRTTPVEENQKSVRELRVSVAELESKLQTVQEEKFVLEARIEQRHLQGDFDPMKTKVVHFRNNPAALAQKQRGEELVRLRAENDRLRERVKLLETSGGQLEDLTVLVEKNVQENPAQSLDDLKAQVSTAELKNQRLIEAFKKTSQEFREICYLLTGYKIDIYQTKQYRLTNMYAESPDDCLLFKQSSSGDVQLLETNYAATLQGLMEVYLQKQDSIPGLLSALTLELLSHQTIKQ